MATMIAYCVAGSDVLDTPDLRLRTLAGGDPVRVTGEAGDHISPTWSPDGGHIAYVIAVPGQPCRIMVTPTPTGASHQVGRCQNEERSQVVWARSGQTLFFVDRPASQASERIVRLDLANGARADLTPSARQQPGRSEHRRLARRPLDQFRADPHRRGQPAGRARSGLRTRTVDRQEPRFQPGRLDLGLARRARLGPDGWRQRDPGLSGERRAAAAPAVGPAADGPHRHGSEWPGGGRGQHRGVQPGLGASPPGPGNRPPFSIHQRRWMAGRRSRRTGPWP